MAPEPYPQPVVPLAFPAEPPPIHQPGVGPVEVEVQLPGPPGAADEGVEETPPIQPANAPEAAL